MKRIIPILISISTLGCYPESPHTERLLIDNFDELKRGPLGVEVGAHTEYHYLHEAAPKGNWAVSTFSWEPEFMLAWEVRKIGDDQRIIQTYTNTPHRHTHPMLITGDEIWEDYEILVVFYPKNKALQSGVVFRYQNDRCYYFCGLQNDSLFVKMVNHATGFHKPYEKILAKELLEWSIGDPIQLSITADGPNITVVSSGKTLRIEDATYERGKVGLMADGPTEYSSISVMTTLEGIKQYNLDIESREKELQDRLAENPEMKIWKKINTSGFGVGRNLRFGDLNNDGQIDVLIGQVVHHGPQDRNSELSCLTAMTFDGQMLWQIGTPDRWKNHLTNDVAFQIHDLNNDGKNEVVYCKNLEIIVADAATGHTLYKKPTPRVTDQEVITPSTHNRFGQILGDCLFFCDLAGAGHDQNILIKDRYRRVWALDEHLNVLWYRNLNTGHYPYAYDVDDDGKEEIMIGYSLLDDDGSILWTLEDKVDDHADGVAIMKMNENSDPILLCAASDEGLFFADMKGNIIKHHYIGHGQNPAIANFRDDLPGLEAVSINFWGNQGIIHYYNAEGDIYHSFEPNQYGSMCLPINWTGNSEEYFVHNPNVDEGGLFDGWGLKVVEFPDDGHPDMCNAVLDITGDCRDEIVVWDHNEIWVYTQDDNPKQGKLYKPQRNALYNYSNYQATVSLPGWGQ